MDLGEIVSGQRNKWNLIRKLGEGDAGEVFLVESLLEGSPAILKRPRQSALSNEVLRQASQIRSEGRVLNSLEGITLSSPLHIPALLDQSPLEADFGQHLFIVVEVAAGVDLKSMTRIAQFDHLQSDAHVSEMHRPFIERLAARRSIPEPVLLRILSGLVELLERIHFTELTSDGGQFFGVIWNDIKPEHLYWDAVHSRLTVIDWGNSQFLEADGATRDRRYSCNDDYYQFVTEMGRFLFETDPKLHARLSWPEEVQPGNAYSECFKPLKEKIVRFNAEALEALKSLRRAEVEIIATSLPEFSQLGLLEDTHQQILDYGELPDFGIAYKFNARLALKLAGECNFAQFREICDLNRVMDKAQPAKWEILERLAGIALDSDLIPSDIWCRVLSAGAADEWPSVLWEILSGLDGSQLPQWWDDISGQIRQLHLQTEPDSLTPYIAVSRHYFTLQAKIIPSDNSNEQDDTSSAQDSQGVLQVFNEEVIKKWKDPQPAPPNSGVEYRDIDHLIDDIDRVLPGAKETLESILVQPKEQALKVIAAWESVDFDAARRHLRRLLLWDPHRRRLIQADRALDRASRWLMKVHHGAGKNEPFYDFLTETELSGRELRSQVGAATWLDRILEAFKQLRKGAKPADLILQYPELNQELPWLYEYRSRETIALPHSAPLDPDYEPNSHRLQNTVDGLKEGYLGRNRDLWLLEPLDNWIPEARGSSARVFSVQIKDGAGLEPTYALKLMRPDRIEYSLPLFREEVQILTVLHDIPGVTPMLECGFIKFQDGSSLPEEGSSAPVEELPGSVIRYGAGEVQNFLASLDANIDRGWLPYLILQRRDHAQNLMVYCDIGYTRGWFLPLRQALFLAIKICDVLEVVHARNIVYRDHKILHYYWDSNAQQVVMIDWNISQRHPQGLSDTERLFDIVQFGARALHHILAGRPAPGALPLGPNRPEEIEQASDSYAVQWTYDDERLPARIKEILEGVLNQGYTKFKSLRQDLMNVYQQFPDA